MGNGINGAIARLQYNNAIELVTKAGLSPNDVVLSQSTLRLEQKLATGVSQYTFGILVNDNGPAGTRFPTEIRLNQQDSFITSELAFYLGHAASDADDAYTDHAYESPAVFTAPIAAQLGKIYKSQLKITVNNKVITPTLQLGRFRVVPQSQQVTAAANQNGIAMDQIDMSTDGTMPTGPSFVLIGSKNNLIQVTLPSALTTVGTSDRLIIEFRGHLAQNSTIIT